MNNKVDLYLILVFHIILVLDMLKTLLERAAPVEDYVEYMDKIVERRLIKVTILFRMIQPQISPTE